MPGRDQHEASGTAGSATLGARPLERRLVVLSPHLDDGALSLGATIAWASRAGMRVVVLTVFADDPESERKAGVWDALCGFATAGEAARARRIEDRRACTILGAEPIWLPFGSENYAETRSGDEVWSALEPHLNDAALVLLPGHPLEHADHVWLTQLVTQRADASNLGFYVEQPYANLTAIGRGYAKVTLAAASIALRTQHGRALQQPASKTDLGLTLEWYAAQSDRQARRAKVESIQAYESQVRWLGRRLIPRIRVYDWAWGGEGIGLPADSRRAHRRVRKWDVRSLAIAR